ncbi:unnamed protein product [Gongylonema pulchrum]|uniref:PAP-associated domain-containing protein n=1 Tax=Gongylonema pulchrum TaxID=637853 RepID=A0A183DPH2_9BILA|nr:unnamed protein product [Gongylonema pulchrum]
MLTPSENTAPNLKIELEKPFAGLCVEICCNNIDALRSAHMLHYYSRVDDRFPALCLIVSEWAKKVGIDDANMGFLSSYAWELLVLHFLQCGRVINKDPAGELLIQFFDYYSRFDFSENAISIKRGTVVKRATDKEDPVSWKPVQQRDRRAGLHAQRAGLLEDTQIFKMFIEDPFSECNASATVKQMSELLKIQGAFDIARDSFVGPHAREPLLSNIL